MKQEKRTVTVTWQDAEGQGSNRLTVRLRWLQIGAGAMLAAILGAVVLGAVAVRLHRQSADLYAGRGATEQERDRLAQELIETRREMEQARNSLARVRTEEAKIRSWLGLETPAEDPAAASPAEERDDGGKGSLGEVVLETVAPAARTAEAEAATRPGLEDEARTLAADLADLAVFVEKKKEGWDAIPAISPVAGEHWISSAFGWRSSPFTGKREFHNGLDMAGRRGTPVVATANGRVHRVFNDSGLGRGLSIDHGNGIRTIYGHMDKVEVKKGQKVRRDQQVGLMGSSGKRSTGPHVHYALKVDGQYVNPRNYLLDRTRASSAVAKK